MMNLKNSGCNKILFINLILYKYFRIIDPEKAIHFRNEKLLFCPDPIKYEFYLKWYTALLIDPNFDLQNFLD